MVSKENIKQLSWEFYAKNELEPLTKQVVDYVKKNNIKVDAVVPLLRGGNIPGTYIAFKLNILRIVPVQYKYFFEGNDAELIEIQTIKKELFDKEDPVFVLVEGNHCYGVSANCAAKGLKKKFPKCRIIYAASNMDYNYQDAVKDAEVCFHGRFNNDCQELSKEKCIELGIDPEKTIIFPWENVEEERITMQMEQYPFKDTNETRKGGEVKEKFDLTKYKELYKDK